MGTQKIDPEKVAWWFKVIAAVASTIAGFLVGMGSASAANLLNII